MPENGILEKLKGLLSNPAVQGVAGAAAFGANPLLGLLAAPGIKSSRDRREMQNENARRSLDARKRLPGLLGEQVGSGQSVTAPGMNLDLLEGGIQELPGKRYQQSMPYVNTPEGGAELQGLLTDIAPETAVAGMLSSQGQQSKPSAFEEKFGFITSLRDAGLIDDEQWLQGSLQMSGALPTQLDPNLKTLTTLGVREAERAERESQLKSGDLLIDTKAGVDKAANRISRIIQLTGELTGTAVEPGLPFAEVRLPFINAWSALEQWASGKPSALRGNLAKLDELKKDFSALLLEMGGSLGDKGYGTITNQKLAIAQQAMANENVRPAAIMAIMKNLSGDLLVEEAKIQLRDPSYRMPLREYLEVMAEPNGNSAGAGAAGEGEPRRVVTGIPAPAGAVEVPQR